MSIVTAIISNALFVVLLPVHLVRQAVYCSRAIVRFAISTIEFAISMLHYYTQEQKRIRLVRHRMAHAPTYERFVRHATELDTLTGQDIWKRDNDAAGLYNAEQIEGYIYHLRELVSLGAVESAAFALHSMASRNIAGTGNEKLYRRCAIGTKHLIEEYIDTVHRTLLFIRDFRPASSSPIITTTTTGSSSSSLHTNMGKYKFFRTLLDCYGRTALMFSGGANMAMCSLGVAKALHDRNLLPKVITGSSGGAIVAAILATKREDEVASCFLRGAFHMDAFERHDHGHSHSHGRRWRQRQQRRNGGSLSPLRKVMRLLKAGVLMDIEKLQRCVRENIGDVTLEEAYRRSGKILNITVRSSSSRQSMPFVLNYLTAPSVLVWSAACASCALPLVFKPVPLLAKDPRTGAIRPFHPSNVKFSDGSFLADLPSTRVAELFNVNFTIVSQTNPHVVPFLDVESDEDDWISVRGGDDNDDSCSSSSSGNSSGNSSGRSCSGNGGGGGGGGGGITSSLRGILSAASFLLSLSSSSMVRRCFRVCKHFVLEEVRFRIMRLYEYGLVPKKLAFFEGIVSQTFTGDVTVAPMRVSMSSLRVLLSNPDDDYIQRCLREGERKTWKAISIIQNKCRVERTLEECVDYMKLRVLEDLRNGAQSVVEDDEMVNDLVLSVLTEPTRFPVRHHYHHGRRSCQHHHSSRTAIDPLGHSGTAEVASAAVPSPAASSMLLTPPDSRLLSLATPASDSESIGSARAPATSAASNMLSSSEEMEESERDCVE